MAEDLTNKFFRVSKQDATWHINTNAPASPPVALAVCGVTSDTPLYTSGIHGVTNSPASVPERCLYCDNPKVLKRPELIAKEKAEQEKETA